MSGRCLLDGVFELLLGCSITPESMETHPPQARALLGGALGQEFEQHRAVIRRGNKGHLALQDMGLKGARAIPAIKAGCCAARVPAVRAAARVKGAEEITQVWCQGMEKVGRRGGLAASRAVSGPWLARPTLNPAIRPGAPSHALPSPPTRPPRPPRPPKPHAARAVTRRTAVEPVQERLLSKIPVPC